LRNWDPRPLRGTLAEAEESLGLSPALFAPALQILEDTAAPGERGSNWSAHLPESSAWWFLIDRMVAPASGAAIAYLKLPAGATPEQREIIRAKIHHVLPGALVTGWSQALASLIPWAQRELVVFGGMVTVIVLGILAFVYRDGRLWAIHVVSLAAAAAGTVATLKLLQMPVNLLNVLAFPLMLGVGVDYGTHVILALRETGDRLGNLAGVLKPIALSGLTTATGFGSLMLAQNPALSGLGAICAIGVTWCLVASLLLVAPAAAWHSRRNSGAG
ncbi:MAG TPA: MMPL family transporter, partial [Terrimicrobiaceae bacterium]|nr:MMPL family transporter [Terrimicrobiaceae bacterium]